MRAVLYVRVSKGDGDQNPETQLQALRRWSRDRGWEPIAEYRDLVTGDPLRRGRHPAGLVAAMTLIEQRKAGVLVIFAADRLVRSPIQLLQLVAHVQAVGGRVASLQDGAELDTTSDTGELLVFLRGWMARWELRLTRARTIAGLERARAQGKRLGRPAVALPDAVQLAGLLSQGVGGRQRLAQALGCSVWAVRKVLKDLVKNGSAKNAQSPSGLTAL